MPRNSPSHPYFADSLDARTWPQSNHPAQWPAPLFPWNPDSIRAAMDQAWRDHHHARDQTWNAVKMEATLAAGLWAVDNQLHSAVATTQVAVLVVFSTISGFLISLHHRRVEIRNFQHILNCEKALSLHDPDLICDVKPPGELRLRDAFRPSVRQFSS